MILKPIFSFSLSLRQRLVLCAIVLVGGTCAESGSLIAKPRTDCLLETPVCKEDSMSDLRSSADSLAAQVDSTQAASSEDTIAAAQMLSPNSLPIAPRTRVLTALGESVAAHVGIWAFNKYVEHQDFANLSWQTVKRNLRLNQWFWDPDLMYTNLFEHPYHGNIYFSAARSNGLGFATSAAFSVGGAMLWEIAGEKELLSVNDVLATSFGGIALGESLHRLSDQILDERVGGVSRLLRELASGVVSPVRLLTRVLSGEAWRRSVERRNAIVPLDGWVTLGWRGVGLRDAATPQGSERYNTHAVELSLSYGAPVAPEGRQRPFDYFTFALGFSPDGHKNIVNHLNIAARLRSWRIASGRFQAELGCYQHFNYHYTEATTRGSVPYKMTETASLGLGAVWEWENGNWRIGQVLHANAVALGAMMTDYPNPIYRKDYNLGSGFALKLLTRMRAGGRLWVDFDVAYHRLFTWMDYADAGRSGFQGDGSAARLWRISPQMFLRLWREWGVSLAGAYYARSTRYRYYPNRLGESWEWRVGVSRRL